MVHQQKWHVVIVGTEPGVYSSWIEAGPKTKNIPGGSIYQSFLSEDEAIRVFEAARARGEVTAWPNAGKKVKSNDKPKNVPTPLSPLGVEAALLRAPSEMRGDTDSTGLQTPLSASSAHARVSRLRRTLKDSTNPCSTCSSPPTEVTQRYPPLYDEDDSPPDSPAAQPLPHFTFSSISSGAYLDSPDGLLLEAGAGDMPFQFESDWDLPSPTRSAYSHSGAEEHTSKPPRCMPRHPEPPPRSMGVMYRSLTDLADTVRSVDSRIWLPKSRVFDPDKVKPRPLTRPSSPAKGETSPVLSHAVVGDSPQLPFQTSLVDSPFVRTDRGRRSRLAPSLSLSALQDQEVGDDCSNFRSRPTRPLENRHTGKGKEKEFEYSVRDKPLAEEPTVRSSSPGNDGRSHVQLVPRDDRDEQSAIMVHCPPNCLHGTCYYRPLPVIEPSRPAGSRHVDACVSPIITLIGRTQETGKLAKTGFKQPDLDGHHPYELAGSTHVSHKGTAPETDVRSPIVKGTMVPMNVIEVGRIRWRNASRARRLTCLTGVLALSDLTCFSVVLVMTVLAHVFWALQNTFGATVSSSPSS